MSYAHKPKYRLSISEDCEFFANKIQFSVTKSHSQASVIEEVLVPEDHAAQGDVLCC